MDVLSSSLEVNRALQSLGSGLLAVMNFFSFLGREEFFLALMPLLFWCVSKPLGTDMGVLLIFSNTLGGWAKGLFKQPRPFWLEPQLGLSTETSYGLPSSHAMNATVLWGFLAMRLQPLWRWLLVLLILLISLSRLYLGVHFLTDVLGGWLLGVLLLVLYSRLRPHVAAWLGRLSLAAHVIWAAVAMLIVFTLYVIAIILPVSGSERYGSLFIDGLNDAYQSAGSCAGMVLGLWIGLAAEARYVQFVVTGGFGQRAARYLLGMVGVLALWLGLKMVFPTDPFALGMVLRVVRYALVILWVLWIWPWLFVSLGLCESQPAARLSPAP